MSFHISSLLFGMFVALFAVAFALNRRAKRKSAPRRVPISVNYHFTRQCNYQCGFCFHTAKTSHVESVDKAKRALRMLKDAGMEKINFAGGEPFVQAKQLGEMCKYCKELGLCVSIVSNGSLITDSWLRKYGEYVDLIALSVDSINEDTAIEMGRTDKHERGDSVAKAKTAAELIHKAGIGLRLNTVVTTMNKDEDMHDLVRAMKPMRWKVFQCLIVDGENAGEAALRRAEEFVINGNAFNEFVARHRDIPELVVEDNDTMRDSYLLLDEYLRFLDCSQGGKTPSQSILDVGVDRALEQSHYFDTVKFKHRDGSYYSSFTKPKPFPTDIEDLVT